MSVKNKCRVRWCNENGTHWHSCSLTGDHEGPHENCNGLLPPQSALLFTYNAWGNRTGSITNREDRHGGREF